MLIIWPTARNPAVLCACGQGRAAFDQVNRAVDAAVYHKGEERALREAEAGALVLLDILKGDALLDLIPDLSKVGLVSGVRVPQGREAGAARG